MMRRRIPSRKNIRVKRLLMRNMQSADDQKINVVTWNVEGKGSPEDIDKALTKTLKQCPDVLCLQEANLPAAGEGTENFKWHCSGVYGSAVLIRKSSNVEASNFERLCDQICIVEVTGNKGIKSKVISCYIPPSSDYVCADVWTKLVDLIKTIHSNMMFVLAGDFNAEMNFAGNNASSASKDSQDFANENGVKLKELIGKAHLRVISTVGFSAADFYTYKDGDVKSQRDFILIPHLRLGSPNELKTNNWFPGYKHAMHCRGISFSKPFDFLNSTRKSKEEQKSKEEEKPKEVKVKEEESKEEESKEGESKKEESKEEESKEEESKEESELKEEPKSEEDKKLKLLVSTWNVQSTTPEKVDKVLIEQNLQIVCIQEFFLTSDEEIKTDNYTWFLSKKQWSKNVGILVKTSPDVSVSSFEPLSECLCVADVLFHDRPVKIISCHLPLHSDPRHEAVANQLTELISGIEPGTFFILAGDFNTKIEKKDLTAEEKKAYDDNDNFLTKLMLESKLFSNYSGRRTTFFSQTIGSEKNNPHRLFIPGRFKDKFEYSMLARWIPYFDNAIVNLALKELSSIDTNEDLRKDDVKIKVEGGISFTYQEVEFIDEFSDEEEEEKEVKNEKEENEEKEEKEENEGVLTDDIKLSPEDIEKFKSTEASAEDLSRLFNDFVLYFAGNDNRIIGYNLPLNVVARSLKGCKLGKLIIEETLVNPDSVKKNWKRYCRIRWNGILIQETFAENLENAYQVRKRAGRALIDKLHQVFFIIKAKRSFFNNGLAPILMSDDKLAEVLKPVDKASVPTMEEVFKHIEEFFKEDTQAELLFKKEFMENFTEIKEFAKKHKLGYRFFSSSGKREKVNNIAFFKKTKQTTLYNQSVIKTKKSKGLRKKLSSMDEVRNYISNFSKQNSTDELELAGKNFSKDYFARIKHYANRHNLGCRFFTTLHGEDPDNMTVFKRLSPLELREHLKSNSDNVKYYLIPPCGLGVDSKAFVDQFEKENLKSEDKIVQEWYRKNREEKEAAKPAAKSAAKTATKPTIKPAVKRPLRPQNRRNEPPSKRFQRGSLRSGPTRSGPIRSGPTRSGPIRSGPMRSGPVRQQRYEPSRRQQESRKRRFSWQDPWDEPSRYSEPQRSGGDRWMDDREEQPAQQGLLNQVGSLLVLAQQQIYQRKLLETIQQGAGSWNEASAQAPLLQNSGPSWNERERPRENSYRDTVSGRWEGEDRNRNGSYRDAGGSKWSNEGRFRDSGHDQWNDNRRSRGGYQEDSDSFHPTKRPRMETKTVKNPPRVEMPRWRDLAPLILVWPISSRSQLMNKAVAVLEANFPTEYLMAADNSVSVIVSLPHHNGREKKYCLSVAGGKNRAAENALQLLQKHSTIIKPSPNYLCNGHVPNFVRYKVPCQANPRSYIILDKSDTGPLTTETISDILSTFQSSFNEDLFFDKYGYTFKEKVSILDMAKKFNLNCRHFGDDPGFQKLENNYICVYKNKPKEQVLEEVLKMGGAHPKYAIVSNKLPPRIGLNIF